VNTIQSETILTDSLVDESSHHVTEDNHRSCVQHEKERLGKNIDSIQNAGLYEPHYNSFR
jgi:hypothetical protein